MNKSALIATVYNEAGTIRSWLESLLSQSEIPREIVIVDGGSKDGTAEIVEGFFAEHSGDQRRYILLRERCNIARGRNLAIAAAQANVIASSDAGSVLDHHWFEMITKPLHADPHIDVVSGWTEPRYRTPFQHRMKEYDKTLDQINPAKYLPSSRTIAFRKQVWQAVGGYPEWLTLTAEDALFNQNLKRCGFHFHFEANAVVFWEPRPDLRAYLKQMYSYGYGAAEARLYSQAYRNSALRVAFPPLLLLAKRPTRNFLTRYLSQVWSLSGWIAGRCRGNGIPQGWKREDGVLLSPESQKWIEFNPEGRNPEIGHPAA